MQARARLACSASARPGSNPGRPRPTPTSARVGSRSKATGGEGGRAYAKWARPAAGRGESYRDTERGRRTEERGKRAAREKECAQIATATFGTIARIEQRSPVRDAEGGNDDPSELSSGRGDAKREADRILASHAARLPQARQLR
eukprot:6192584-Pleurochrysis_carterae.AAC.2